MATTTSQAGMADPTLTSALATLGRAARLLGVADLAEQATEVAGRLKGLVLEVAVVEEFKRAPPRRTRRPAGVVSKRPSEPRPRGTPPARAAPQTSSPP